MKKIVIAAAALMMLTACSDTADKDGRDYRDAEGVPIAFSTTSGKGYETTVAEETELWTIEGIALPCTNGIVFIISDCNGSYPNPMPISMESADIDRSILDGLAAGDRIKVKSGPIMESYPAAAIISELEKTGSGSIDDIPAEILESLKELGYKAAVEKTPDETEPLTDNPNGRKEVCMVNGEVYFNTGRINNALRCGMLDGSFDELIGEDELPTKDGQANFTCEGNGYQYGMNACTIEVCIDGNWYVFEPLEIPADPEETDNDIPDNCIAVFHGDSGETTYVYKTDNGKDNMGFEYINAKMNAGSSEEEVIGRGETVWTDDIFTAAEKNGAYSFVTLPGDSNSYTVNEFMAMFLMNGARKVIQNEENSPEPESTQLKKIPPLSEETDLQLRTDYAAYVCSTGRYDVSADDVCGEFYYGTYNGYMIVVMCPYHFYTCDIGVYKLRCTDADLKDPDCDCYPYIDVELPSGMFEMYAYKDNKFIPIEEAFEEKLIDYSVSKMIADYMDAYYRLGDRTCIYSVE